MLYVLCITLLILRAALFTFRTEAKPASGSEVSGDCFLLNEFTEGTKWVVVAQMATTICGDR